MKKQGVFRLVSLMFLVFTMGAPAMANNFVDNWFGDSHYSKVNGHGAVGEGKVYVAFYKSNQSAPSDADYSYLSTAQSDVTARTMSAPTHTYVIFAKAEDGYEFDGWYSNADFTTTLTTKTQSGYTTYEFTANSTNQNSPTTNDIYAKFKPFQPVIFSVAAGSYYEPKSVTLSCATSGATIEYSLNNQDNWQNYTTEAIISVTSTTTIYARAKTNKGQSKVYSATYNILPKNSVVFNTPLTIPYGNGTSGTPYTLTTGTSGTVDVKTDGNISSVTVTGNDKIVSVSGSTITPKAVGTTTITVTSAEGDTYLAGNGTITVNVTAPEGVTTAPSGEYTETYTIPSSGYGTYCSQYPIDFTRSFTNGETAYTVKEKTETLVRLHLIEQTSIKGGVGFVVKGEPGTTITFRFIDSSNVPTPNMLFGTTAPTYIEYEEAYGMKDGGFHLNNAGVVPAHRAFIPNESAGSVKALTLDFEEEDPTGIEEFKFEDDSNSVIYNLSGQRIQKMQRGINIVNGKKIMVK